MCKSVEIVEVVKVTTTEGTGVMNDPFREVVQYWSKDGQLLFKENANRSNQIEIHVKSSEIDEKLLIEYMRKIEC